MKTVPMFATENDTGNYAICLDGHVGIFPNKEECERVFALIGGSEVDGGLAETPFASAEMLPPGFVPTFHTEWVAEGKQSKVSECETIDLETYINEAWERYKTADVDNEPILLVEEVQANFLG